MKTYTLEEVTDKYIGKKGTPKREHFETELQLDVISYAIKQAREEKKLSQKELGELVGAEEYQISVLESDLKNVSFELVIRVFKALNSKVRFNIELGQQNLEVV